MKKIFKIQKSSAGVASASPSERATTAGKSSRSRNKDKPADIPVTELNPEEGWLLEYFT